jgi:hypothetical protein
MAKVVSTQSRKFSRTYEDEIMKAVWHYDYDKHPNGPYKVEILRCDGIPTKEKKPKKKVAKQRKSRKLDKSS